MWGDRALGTRERGCMYCEWGSRYAQATLYLRLENINRYAQDTGGVCGGSGRLGHENEDVCIESGEGVYVGDRGAWDTRIRLYVL